MTFQMIAILRPPTQISIQFVEKCGNPLELRAHLFSLHRLGQRGATYNLGQVQ